MGIVVPSARVCRVHSGSAAARSVSLPAWGWGPGYLLSTADFGALHWNTTLRSVAAGTPAYTMAWGMLAHGLISRKYHS